MKKLLLGTLVLLAFNAAVILTQMSCKKEAQAETPITGTSLKQLGVVLFIKVIAATPTQPGSNELWITSLDGSNQKKLNIVLPTGVKMGDEAKLSPDGETVIFDTVQESTGSTNGGIYTCKIDGSNVKPIVNGTSTGYVFLQGVY